MVISYSAETEIVMVEAFYVIEGIEKDCEIVLIEFSIKTCKWLCTGFYKPPSQSEKNFLDNLSRVTNRLTCQYENFMLIGDFNMTTENKNLEVFMNWFGLECLIKKLTCFQSKNSSCIDLILTNKKDLFKNVYLYFPAWKKSSEKEETEIEKEIVEVFKHASDRRKKAGM